MADSLPGCSSPCQPPPVELKLYQAFIFSAPILFTLVVLLLFYMLYLRRQRTTWAASHISGRFFSRGFLSAPSERGLNKSFRDMLPTMIFNESVAAMLEYTQCAVCLGNYQMNEKLQRLPVCGHAFHLDCIDQWLSNNDTCPLCRTSLLQAAKVAPIDLAAQLATSQQAHEPAEVLSPQTSHHHQGHPVEQEPTQESSDIPDITREEPNRPRDEGTCEATHTINLNMQEFEYSARGLPDESSEVKPDYVVCIEPGRA